VKAAACLKQIGPALVLGEAAAKPIFPEQKASPSTRPTTVPSSRGVVILGCSKNHDNDGVQYAPADLPVAIAQPGDAIYTATGPVSVWELLAGGQCVIVLRHCKTDDSTKDAASVNLADRTTQRNLSAAGIDQAKRIGQLFRGKNIPIGKVLSSEFARCKETADLAFGHVFTDPSLNALNDSEAQVRQMRRLLATTPKDGNLVLVTHQANLLSTTKLIPEMGDAVIVQPLGDGSFNVVGKLDLTTPMAPLN
jgi:phosphohistidine phosphatase SixA